MGLFMLGSPPQQRLVYTGPASQLCTTVAPAAQPKTARTRGSPKKRRKHKTAQTRKGRQATSQHKLEPKWLEPKWLEPNGGNASAHANTMHGVHKILGLESKAFVEVLEEPQLPRARGARQQPRRDAIQERTPECMTAVMNAGTAPCGGPGGASTAKRSRRKAATPEGRDSRADSRMHDCGHE